MTRWLFAFALVLAFAAQQCDGDLADFVTIHEIHVENRASVRAHVRIRTMDVTRTVILPARSAMMQIAFASGPYSVEVGPDLFAGASDVRSVAELLLENPGLSPEELRSLTHSIRELNALVSFGERALPAAEGECAGTLKASGGRGQLSLVVLRKDPPDAPWKATCLDY